MKISSDGDEQYLKETNKDDQIVDKFHEITKFASSRHFI
ncbi:hypothetical protein AOR13_1171 [Alteromonas stellipolaris LMG 21856]|nr:hypothetical protein AOR13_1171 [Alteromonas stellipolaris LMG 21856]